MYNPRALLISSYFSCVVLTFVLYRKVAKDNNAFKG